MIGKVRVETLGDYSIKQEYNFPDQLAMRRWEEKQEPGYWYDWSELSSNDPNWSKINLGCKLLDAETGEEIRRVTFYHRGTHYLQRHSVDEKGQPIAVAGMVATICETRQLIIEPIR